MLKEKNYDFRKRHWTYHKPDRRDPERVAAENEVMLTADWKIGYAAGNPIAVIAANDFQEYLETSMGVSLPITKTDGEKTLWLEVSDNVAEGFILTVEPDHIRITAASDKMTFRGTIHVEDLMNLEEAPVLTKGEFIRRPMYLRRTVHCSMPVMIPLTSSLRESTRTISATVISMTSLSVQTVSGSILFFITTSRHLFIRMKRAHRKNLMLFTARSSVVIPK